MKRTPEAAVEALRKQFLHPAGWERSAHDDKPLRADGIPLPWFTYSAIEFLCRTVRPTDRVFEYGSGYGTIWWQTIALSVRSVDHDPEWCDALRPRLAPNTCLSHVEAGAPVPPEAAPVLARFARRRRQREWPNYPPERVTRRGLQDEGFEGYAAAILGQQAPYDIVVIDGMARRLCTEFAVGCIADNGFIVFDNSNRGDYDTAFDILGEAGFSQIPFWGLVPGATFHTCTSIFLRDMGRLADAQHRTSAFGLPEY